MAKTLLEEIFNQVTGRRSHHRNHNTYNKNLQRELYKLKQAAFENKKAYEISKLRAKSKGWI